MFELSNNTINPLTIARSFFLNRATDARIDSFKVSDFFKALHARSLYGEGFVDPLFANIAFKQASLVKQEQVGRKIFLIKGDFVNARGARKLVNSVVKQSGDQNQFNNYYELRQNALGKMNLFIRAQAQLARSAILGFAVKQGLSGESVTCIATPGDELTIMLDLGSTELSESFHIDLENFLERLNINLKEQAVSFGFDANAHLKDKPQGGFGLVLTSELFSGNFENHIDRIDSKLSAVKEKLYKVPKGSEKVTRDQILLHQVPGEICDLISASIKKLPKADEINIQALLKDLQGSCDLSNAEVINFFDHLNKLLNLHNETTGTLMGWHLDEVFEQSEIGLQTSNSGAKPKLVMVNGSSIAGLNTIAPSFANNYIRYISDLIKTKLREAGYAEDIVRELVFYESAAFNWVLLPIYKDKEKTQLFTKDELDKLELNLTKNLEEEIKDLNMLSVGDFIKKTNEKYHLKQELSTDKSLIRIGEIKNPKLYFKGAEPYQRFGLHPICLSTTISDSQNTVNHWQAEILKKLQQVKIDRLAI